MKKGALIHQDIFRGDYKEIIREDNYSPLDGNVKIKEMYLTGRDEK